LLSVNFGQVQNNKFTRNGSKQRLNQSSIADGQSVSSVITKGGTINNPFSNRKQSSHKYLAKSNSKMASKDNQTSRSKFADGQDLVAGEKNLENAKSTSKTQVRFGEELDEGLDIRKSIQKNNAKMINIYLKTPYKVLTINEIKTKEKEVRDRDLEANISPNRLFRAENNLAISTKYRGVQK
jgi:hypothetical protein